MGMAEQLTQLQLNNLSHYTIEELVRRFRDDDDPLIKLFCVRFDKEIDFAIENAQETDTEVEMELDDAKTKLVEYEDIIEGLRTENAALKEKAKTAEQTAA